MFTPFINVKLLVKGEELLLSHDMNLSVLVSEIGTYPILCVSLTKVEIGEY
nr:MAG TPA: hypothetical protein [Caudoviricetes sp.]